MTMLRMALFDFDGTLCDSVASIIRLTQLACARAEVAIPDEGAIRQQIGAGLFDAGMVYAKGDTAKAQMIFDGYRAEAKRQYAMKDKPLDPLFEGVKAGLQTLANDGWLIGIVTNKGRHGLNAMLEAHALTSLIDVSFTADDVPVKPAPDMALAAIDHFGVMPEDAVLIGDTVNDALCASNAKIAFVGVGWGYHDDDMLRSHGARHIAKDMPDLLDSLNELVRGE